MRETELIRALAARFRRCPAQRNALFASDAEIVTMGEALWGITTDAFSPDEDCFGNASPELIGHNIAVATISDLLAAGCQPSFYLHCLDVPPEGEAFVQRLCDGVSEVLDACDAYLLGGDLGCATTWRCSATALGLLKRSEPLTRLLPARVQALYVTGSLGDSNAAALQMVDPPSFELRLASANSIRLLASACIDTSDGLISALWQWHEVNPASRFELDLNAIPYAPAAREASRSTGIPLPAFLLGGAGEYELLFAADADAQVPDATRIGTVVPATAGDLRIQGGAALTEPPDPRSFADRRTYLDALLAHLATWL